MLGSHDVGRQVADEGHIASYLALYLYVECREGGREGGGRR